MILNGDIYTLDTGRTFYANRGILGLSPELGAYQGYDGNLYLNWSRENVELYAGSEGFTPEERIEIAEEMITRWEAWKLNGK